MTDRDFWKFFAGLVATLVGVTVLLFVIAAAIGGKPTKPNPAMQASAIADRIKPVGEVTMGALDAVVSTANAADKGASTYNAVCVACHGSGLAGAPKFGDKAAWAPRLAQGVDALHQHALKGKNAMPPKGGYSGPDADVIAAVDYMISKVK
jgi:cytochrome c5